MFVTICAVLEERKLLTMFNNANLLRLITSFTYTFIFTLGICIIFLACSSANVSESIVTVGQSSFVVEVADGPNERIQGLSGRKSLNQMNGMLFVFESGEATGFWMKGMMFNLDFIWIGENCMVVDTISNVPFPMPGSKDKELDLYSPDVPATYVLEVNGGIVDHLGISIDDKVLFTGISTIGVGC